MAGKTNPDVGARDEGATELSDVKEFIRKAVSRRDFIKVTGTTAVAFYVVGCSSERNDGVAPRQVYVANAQGMIVADAALCVACRRCELACSAYNTGETQPALSKVKVNRNLLFGVAGAQVGMVRGDGIFGNFRVVQDTCRQCPHPVPCQVACPNGAIEVVPPVNARVVNESKCTGCGICAEACPWEMISLTGAPAAAGTKATKCTLCDGNPECVEACPAGALQYMPWDDRTMNVPTRTSGSGVIAADIADSCGKCH